MALWNKSQKPAWLTKEQQENCVATARGWVLKRKNGTEELLVSIRGLDKEQPKVEVKQPEVKKEQPKVEVKKEPKKEPVVEQPKVEVKKEPIVEEVVEQPKVEEIIEE